MREISHFLKKILLKLYPAYLLVEELSFVSHFIGSFENRQPFFLRARYNEFEIVKGEVKTDFLVATKGAGLLFFKGGKCFRLFPHEVFYGLTKNKDFWYAYHQIGFSGRIIRFQLIENNIEGLTVFVWGLSKGIHQIDFINDELVVVDTYYNRLIVYKDTSNIHNEYWKENANIYYPNGELLQGRKSPNYNHFNSVYSFNEDIYLVAHNETFKTKRESEVFVLTSDFLFKEKRSAGGSNCHNYYRDNEIELIGRSLEGDMILNGTDIVAKSNMFTRGLAVMEESFMVGGSSVQFNRELRRQGTSNIKIYDRRFQLQTEITLKNIQVQEIRLVSESDFGLSATPNKCSATCA